MVLPALLDKELEKSMDISTALPSWTLRVSNAVGYVVLILVNVAAGTGLFGPTNADISAKFSTPLTPAGWAFSIWGLIFGLQGLGVVYALAPWGYGPDGWKQRMVNAIGYGWQAAWYCEVAWQAFFLLQTAGGMWLCLAALLGAFAAMAATLLRLYRLKDHCGSLGSPQLPLYALFFLPTSLNAAWLSVAASLGVIIVPRAYGVTAGLEWLAILLAAGFTLLGLGALHRERDSAYGLTLVWALVAVYAHQPSRAVKAASLACISVLVLFVIFSVLRRRGGGASGSGGSAAALAARGDAGDDATARAALPVREGSMRQPLRSPSMTEHD